MLMQKSQLQTGSEVEVTSKDSHEVNLEWGHSQTAFGRVTAGMHTRFSTQSVDLCQETPRASYRRQLVGHQLISGHMRIDLGNPLTQGNFIFFKGKANIGKTTVALSTIRNFLRENNLNRAIYVGLTKNAGEKLIQQITDEKQRSRVMALGVDSTNKSYNSLSTDAEYIMAPHIALKAAQEHKRTLIVFDDVLLHTFKEKLVYDKAGQPAPPKLILNELMEHTGIFKDGREVTTIVVGDIESNSLQFQKDEDLLISHIESICDQVINFDCEQSTKRLGRVVPILPVKPGQKYLNQKAWLNPFVTLMGKRYQRLTENMDKAYV